MAVPTLTSITPSSGHPGGRELVRIEGTNFELPPTPAATGYVGGSCPETVQVEVDSEFATEVKVWTSELITCLVPSFRGEPSALSASPGLSVDVLIRNLTGPEEDTFADAYTFARANLARTDGALKHVLRTLVLELRRQVIDYIVFATQVDFDGDTADTLDIVELAEIPALSLFGPDITEDKFRRSSERPTVQNVPTLEYERKRTPRVFTISFEATLTARGVMELAQLTTELVNFFTRNPKLSVNKDTSDPTAGRVEFDMFLNSGPSRTGSANADDVYSATASFAIHGVPIDADEGTRVEWGKMLDDPPDVEMSYEQKG